MFAHRLLRTLALLLGVLNASFAAAEAVLVLYALEVLHLSTVGYGLLLTLVALGGLAGTVLAPILLRRLGVRVMLPGGGAGAGAGAAGRRSDLLARRGGAAMLVIGVSSMAWNVVTISLRQRIVPARLLGRVTSSYRMIGLGAMPIGALLGGVLAKAWGLHSPYLLAGCALLLATLVSLPFLYEPEPVAQPG